MEQRAGQIVDRVEMREAGDEIMRPVLYRQLFVRKTHLCDPVAARDQPGFEQARIAPEDPGIARFALHEVDPFIDVATALLGAPAGGFAHLRPVTGTAGASTEESGVGEEGVGS